MFACPAPASLGSFYAELLGMRIIRTDWFVIAADENSSPRLAFDHEAGFRPPRSGDPENPRQLHLDLASRDLDTAEELAIQLGATRLREKGHDRSYADPAGHPFCLYAEPEDSNRVNAPPPCRIGRVVYECFSPRALATFYEELLSMHVRKNDSEHWVVIARDDGVGPDLAFQHAVFQAPRWPDPKYPEQIHLDLHVDDSVSAQALVLSLGAIGLPAQGGSCPVFADPAAHPFCLCAPGQ